LRSFAGGFIEDEHTRAFAGDGASACNSGLPEFVPANPDQASISVKR